MLLANYASDSDSGSDTESAPSVAPPKPQPPPQPQAKPATKRRKGPIKIGLDLPTPTAADEEDKPEEDRSFKKPRVGAGSSSLLGMLPPPKRKLPNTAAKPSPLAVNRSMAKPKLPAAVPTPKADDSDDEGELMVPATLKRAEAKKPAAELDLFGLAEAAPKSKKREEVVAPQPPTVSAAPAVADFVPPEPTASDPYPGYYQLPSGSWAAYDPEYYASFFPGSNAAAEEEKAKKERTGRAWAELDEGRAHVVDFDVASRLQEGRAERERLEAASKFKPKYGGDFEYKEIGQTKGLAAERHQLTSLLSNAFSQREELEARIAQNKKNMQGAGSKYGF